MLRLFANSTVIQVLLQFSFSFSDMLQVIVYINKQLKMLELGATDVNMRGWCIFQTATAFAILI